MADEHERLRQLLAEAENLLERMRDTTGSGPIVDPDQVKCSFCGKSRKDVEHMIIGPGVYICNECVDMSVNLINEGRAQS